MKKLVVIAATCALLGSATAALAAGDATAGSTRASRGASGGDASVAVSAERDATGGVIVGHWRSIC